MAGQCVQILDESVIVLGKPEELLGLTFRLRLGPGSNLLCLGWVGGHSLSRYNMAQILHLVPKERTLSHL